MGGTRVWLNGVRVGAKDVAGLARFYRQAFGMQEVQRIEIPQMLEIMLNFGATPQDAQARRARLGGGDIVILSRDSDDVAQDLAHVVLNVADMADAVQALEAAGGRMQREPFAFGDSGVTVGMALDPAGNSIELLEGAMPPPRE